MPRPSRSINRLRWRSPTPTRATLKATRYPWPAAIRTPTCSISSATNLPPGLTLNPNGVITGTISRSNAVGVYTVVVNAVDDGVAGSDTFAWNVNGPSITNLNPNLEMEGSGSFTLTVTGTDFQSGQTTVTVNGNTAVTFTPTVLSATQLTVNIPANELQQDGPLTVTVTVPDDSGIPGHTLTSNAETFTITPPTLFTFTYPPQTTNEGATITPLSSSNTDPNASNWTATGLPLGLSINPNTGVISGTISNNAGVGVFTVVVNATDDGTPGSDTFTWTVTGPQITNVSPNTAMEGSGSFTMTITGTEFVSGSTTVTINGHSTVTLTPTVLSPTQLTVNVPAAVLQQDGPLTITVTVLSGGPPAGNVVSNADTFTITPPSLLTFTYQNQTSLEGSTVSLLSDVTNPPGDTNVGNWTATGLPPGLSINPNNGTITGTISLTGAGVYTVVVDATDDTTASSDTFTWTVGPEISSVSPNIEPEGSGSVTLTITGAEFQTGNTTVTVKGNSVVTLTPTVLSPTQLTVNLPANLLQQDGPLTITVTVPNGSGGMLVSNTDTFTITPPSLLTFTYQNQTSLEGSTVTLLSDVTNPPGDTNVSGWTATGLPPGLSINPNNGTIAGTIASAGVGNYSVVVSAVDDGTHGSDAFTWTVGPEITSVSPNTAAEGSGSFTLTINGVEFQPGSTTVSISGNNVVNLTPSSNNGSQLTVNVPATVLDQDGPLSITVVVPDGSGLPGHTAISNTDTFTITPPATLVFTYPNQVDNVDSSVTVSSSNTDPNVGNWSATGLPTGLSINPSNGTIAGTIAPTDIGNYTVLVNAIDDGTSGSNTFTWMVGPEITSVGPNTAMEGSGSFTMTIDGADFVSGSTTVTITGHSTVTLTPTVVSPTQLTVNVPAAVLEQDGPLTITVTVPDGSGTPGRFLTSSADTFTIAPPAVLNFTYANQINVEGDTVSSVSSSNTDPNVGNWTATGLPSGLSINPNNGTIAGTISRTGIGNYTVVVDAVDDGTLGSDTFSWTVTGPSITSITPNTAMEGSGSFTMTITGTDFQVGNTTVTVSGNTATNLTPNVLQRRPS